MMRYLISALKSIKFSLKAVIASANGSQALPEKDTFNPNQKTWAKTAKCMGVRKGPKRKYGSHGPTNGSINTEKCIGTVKGKCTYKYSDPYAAGKRLGKYAKPDVISAAANECARTAMPPPPPLCLPPVTPAHVSPSAAASSSATHYFPCTSQIMADPLGYLLSSMAPGLMFSPLPMFPPGTMFTPLSRTFTGSAYLGNFILNNSWALFQPRNVLMCTQNPSGHLT